MLRNMGAQVLVCFFASAADENLDYFRRHLARGAQTALTNRSAYNNVHRNTTLVSPLTAGLLNVIKVAPEVIETKCF